MVTKIKDSLYIFMNGYLVGHLQKLNSGGLTFTYDQEWLEIPGTRPISLSLPLTPQPYQGDIVYNFFDNLLPDNESVKKHIQTMFHAPSTQPFDLLASIGHDCVGAIQLCRNIKAAQVKSIRCETLTELQIANMLKNYRLAPLGMNRDMDFRISIAGAQQKTALLLMEGRWHRPLGATPTTHIFKLPIGFIEHQGGIDLRDSCENEWLCSKIAEAFGLPVAHTEIHQFDGVKVLVVERFDRKFSADGTWIMRLPQEDMCQALGYSPAFKYQADGGPGIKEIMSLLLGAEHPNEDRELFYRYQILFWLLAAIDGHAKNFSLFIKPAGRFQLTPLYDILSAYPLLAAKQLQKQKITMAMALKGRENHYHWYNIQRRHFLSTAKAVQFSVETAEKILDDMLAQVEEVIKKTSAQLPNSFPAAIAESLFNGMIQCRDRLLKA
jgi:serine/threonine-protein kinase HipA